MSYQYATLEHIVNETIQQARYYVSTGVLPEGFHNAAPLVDRLSTRLEVLFKAYLTLQKSR